ncbi:MAG: DUF3047 domain-containing protein [Candidatus Omnitrophica bacterium]|nr:DUF3047 domain-containing protein [Candidatus Omnitrophota bacterium]
MRARRIGYSLILVMLFLFIYHAYAGELPKWFLFDRKTSLKEWQEKVFKNKVLYAVQPGEGVLVASSEKACSGLFYRMSFSPREFPMISWQWKVAKFPEKGPKDSVNADNESSWIEKDDYAARVYVIFPSLIFSKTKCIEYIWDKDLAEGTVMTSPYFRNIKLIVAESGPNLGQWVGEERNIYEDYKKVFGKPPRANVGAIALMTDTDNTLSSAEASYKDIKVGYRDEKPEKKDIR